MSLTLKQLYTLSVIRSQYHAWWWSDDFRSQDISAFVILIYMSLYDFKIISMHYPSTISSLFYLSITLNTHRNFIWGILYTSMILYSFCESITDIERGIKMILTNPSVIKDHVNCISSFMNKNVRVLTFSFRVIMQDITGNKWISYKCPVLTFSELCLDEMFCWFWNLV